MIEGYDDLDMSGLLPAWYRDVPIQVQKTVNTVPGEDLRVLRNHGGDSPWTVVARAPRCRQNYWGGVLIGWGIFMHWDQPLGDGGGIRANIEGMIRFLDSNEDPETHNARVDAAIDAHRAKVLAQSDVDLEDFVDDHDIDRSHVEAAAARDYDRSSEREQDVEHWIRKQGSRNAAPSSVKLVVPSGGGWVEKAV